MSILISCHLACCAVHDILRHVEGPGFLYVAKVSLLQ